MRIYLVMNPGSRDGNSKALFSNIFGYLDEYGIDYEYRTTETLEDAYFLSKEANEKGEYDAVIAVGGDGTINRALCGFFNDDGARNSKAKMGIIYTGTSPDFCKSHGIPLDLKEAIRVVTKYKSKKISVAKIVMAGNNKRENDGRFIPEIEEKKTAYFGCCANIGLGAALARKANAGIRKRLGDFLGTFLSLMNLVFTYKAGDYKTRIDGELGEIRKLANISVGKTRFIASGIQIVNDLEPIDRRLYLFRVENLSFIKWIRALRAVYSGRPIKNSEYMSLSYAEKIEVAGNFKNPEVEFDGDPAGYLPCEIEAAGQELDILCQ